MKKNERSAPSGISLKELFTGVKLEDLHLPELWRKTRRGVVYFLILVLFLLCQNVIFSHITLFGIHSMFVPALVVAVALFEGGHAGGWFGVAAGIMLDLFTTSQGVLFTVLCPLMGFAAGFMADFFFNRRFFTYCIMGAAALLLSAIAQMFPLLVYQGQRAGTLWGVALVQTIWSLPFLVPSYYVCKIIPRRLRREVPSPYRT